MIFFEDLIVVVNIGFFISGLDDRVEGIFEWMDIGILYFVIYSNW